MINEIKYFFSESRKFGIPVTIGNVLLRVTMWAIGAEAWKVQYKKDINQHGVLVASNKNLDNIYV